MIRKALTIFSLIGLLLSVGAWGVSYWNVGFTRPSEISLVVRNGTIELRLSAGSEFNAHDVLVIKQARGYHAWLFAGTVAWCQGFTDWHTEFWSFSCETRPEIDVSCPLWLPCIFFGATTLYYMNPAYRCRKRKKLGLCIKCGYDLRASKDRCPECGTGFSN